MRSLKSHLVITLTIIISLIALDQVTKVMARNHFKKTFIKNDVSQLIPVVDPLLSSKSEMVYQVISRARPTENREPIVVESADTFFVQHSAPINVLGDLFVLQYAENRGAFLSLGKGLSSGMWAALFAIIPTIFIFGFFIYLIKNRSLPLTETIIYSGIVAGGLGNLYDRIRFGYVTDFMNFGIGDLRTGILNVADIPITMGIIYLFIYYAIKELRNKKTKVSAVSVSEESTSEESISE